MHYNIPDSNRWSDSNKTHSFDFFIHCRVESIFRWVRFENLCSRGWLCLRYVFPRDWGQLLRSWRCIPCIRWKRCIDWVSHDGDWSIKVEESNRWEPLCCRAGYFARLGHQIRCEISNCWLFEWRISPTILKGWSKMNSFSVFTIKSTDYLNNLESGKHLGVWFVRLDWKCCRECLRRIFGWESNIFILALLLNLLCSYEFSAMCTSVHWKRSIYSANIRYEVTTFSICENAMIIMIISNSLCWFSLYFFL